MDDSQFLQNQTRRQRRHTTIRFRADAGGLQRCLAEIGLHVTIRTAQSGIVVANLASEQPYDDILNFEANGSGRVQVGNRQRASAPAPDRSGFHRARGSGSTIRAVFRRAGFQSARGSGRKTGRTGTAHLARLARSDPVG